MLDAVLVLLSLEDGFAVVRDVAVWGSVGHPFHAQLGLTPEGGRQISLFLIALALAFFEPLLEGLLLISPRRYFLDDRNSSNDHTNVRLQQSDGEFDEGGSRLAPPILISTPVVAENYFSFGNRPSNHTLLHEAAKDEPPAAGIPSVESECELLQVGLEVSRDHRALMCAQNPALEKTRDAVHTGHRNVGWISRRRKHHSLMHEPVIG